MSERDLSRHRPNVGVVLFNREGLVWVGRRPGVHTYGWQFPQGGVDEGEDVEAAARRELHEETGVESVSLLARTHDWIAYDFPPELRRTKIAKGWDGQKQVWFAFRFEGDESEIRLDLHHEIEFEAWRWVRLEETPDLVVAFKRESYRQVCEAFRHIGPG